MSPLAESWTVSSGAERRRSRTNRNPPVADPADLPGWGLPWWRDEMADRLAYVAAHPSLHPVDPAQYNVRTRSNFGLTFDAAIPASENVTVDSMGRLVLNGTWLPTPQSRTPISGGPSQLTHQTGYVDHRAVNPGDVSRSTRFGRWEIRSKVPTGVNCRGALSAWWLRNLSTGEVDMEESWGEGGPQAADYHTYVKGRSVFTTFGNTSTAAHKTFWRYEQELGIPQTDRVSSDFQTHVVEWTPDYLAIYRNGRQAKRIHPGDTVMEGSTAVNASKYWTDPAYNSPWHMRLNLHIGPSASYWGVPDPNNRQWTIDPLRYEIEHVRIWSI